MYTATLKVSTVIPIELKRVLYDMISERDLKCLNQHYVLFKQIWNGYCQRFIWGHLSTCFYSTVAQH